MKNFSRRLKYSHLLGLLGVFMSVSAYADTIDPVNRRGRSVPDPTTPVYTPPPVTPQTPPPANTPPPPAPLPSAPILVGTASSPASVPTLESLFNQLNQQIGSFNSISPRDLPSAAYTGAQQQVITPTVAPTGENLPPVTQSQSDPNSGIDPIAGRRGRTAPPPPSNVPPSGPTDIELNVTGWSYLVLQWGDTNYHFYVGDVSGIQTFRGSAPLSSYSFFSVQQATVSVSDTGYSLALFGASLGALLVLRRRFGSR